jgi:DnaJ-class molecular chaperone
MPLIRSSRFGDLYVEVHVKTPSKLNRKAKKILKELEKELKG